MWKYRDIVREYILDVEGYGTDNLNFYGRNGWELVTIIEKDDIYHHIFKREK